MFTYGEHSREYSREFRHEWGAFGKTQVETQGVICLSYSNTPLT